MLIQLGEPLDKTILVPLTNSLYVPGKLADLDNVIVDVGTGYYVKKVCSHEPYLIFCITDLYLRHVLKRRSITPLK